MGYGHVQAGWSIPRRGPPPHGYWSVGLVPDPSYELFYRFEKLKGLSAKIIELSQNSEKRLPLTRELHLESESDVDFIFGAVEH
jgi:hypothetical protein